MNLTEYPLITIIVPCHKNHEDVYLSLDSIFIQTYPNIELIISDDCTPEEFSRWEEVEQYASQNRTENIKQMHIIRYERNYGSSRHFNKDIDISTGKYFKLVAPGDELFDKDTLVECIREMEDKDARILVGQTFVKRRSGENTYDDIKDTPLYRWRARSGRLCNYTPSNYDIDYLSKLSDEHLRKVLASRCIISTVSVFFRMDLLHETNGFPTEYRLIEDVAYWPLLALRGEKFYFTHRKMMRYALNGVSNGGDGSSEFYRDFCHILRTKYIPNEYRGGVFNGFIKKVRLKEVDYIEALQTGKQINQFQYIDIKIISLLKNVRYLLLGSKL